jgi:16S rRNA (adenine1518-N6/adenine1519-N6)-dimethyltransferase
LNFRPRKRFGQHFLHDRQVIDRILGAVDPQPGQRLVEIGPGQGALTYPLLQRCGRLVAVEIDRDLVPVLIERAADKGELEVVNADILDFDLSTLGGDGDYRLVGNLPYNISTPLIFHLLESARLIRDMHFMVQREVALRSVANPGEASYGRLSVMLQYRCRCRYLFDVAPGSFRPPPQVDSAVVRLEPYSRPEHDIGDYALFANLVQSAFGQRRKTISNSLKSIIDRDAISACGIDPGLRAENLAIADFARLSRSLCP